MENKKLVVFFTYTGHTKFIVDKIKEQIDCDVLEVKPIKPYSNNYDEVVNEYQDNESAKLTPEIEKINIDLSKYNEIIIGSPVWWYTITPPIRTFLKENNLTSKKLYFFATNAGWLGRTFKEMESLCKNSTIIDEMNIVFNESNLITQEDEINNWIKKLK